MPIYAQIVNLSIWAGKLKVEPLATNHLDTTLQGLIACQNKPKQEVGTFGTLGECKRQSWGLWCVETVRMPAIRKAITYTITGDCAFNGVVFTAKYQPKDTDPTDDNGRLTDKNFAQNLANLLTGKIAKILVAQTEHKKEPAPLPYNLLKLQQEASRKFGYKPDDVMAITQSLREKHHLITYNRSDCQYLSDEQFDDVGGVLSAIAGTFDLMSGACSNANPSQKGRVFNSAKVTAHHAIIPTQTVGNWSSLSEKEQNLYKVIARNYIAQFYPLYEYDETKIMLDVIVDGVAYQFQATARVDTATGWKKLYTHDTGNEEVALPDDVASVDLRSLKTSDMR